MDAEPTANKVCAQEGTRLVSFRTPEEKTSLLAWAFGPEHIPTQLQADKDVRFTIFFTLKSFLQLIIVFRFNLNVKCQYAVFIKIFVVVETQILGRV